jgi:hypothetical protein
MECSALHLLWGFRRTFEESTCGRFCSVVPDDYGFRSRMSMRFHPNRRASIDKAPGPISAKARPMVPSKMFTQGSRDCEIVCQNSRTATMAPAMGVQKPTNNESPAALAKAATIADLIDKPIAKVMTPWLTSPTPTTSRMNKRPTPGQPRAKFENSLRKGVRCRSELTWQTRGTKTSIESGNHSFEYQNSTIPRFSPIIAA